MKRRQEKDRARELVKGFAALCAAALLYEGVEFLRDVERLQRRSRSSTRRKR